MTSEIPLSRTPYTLNLRGRLFTLRRPLVMGIVNLTSDSFYEGSRVQSAEAAACKAEEMVEQGADIIDVGAMSTRPGASAGDAEEEWARLARGLEAIRRRLPEVVVSVDTFRAGVARKCVEQFETDIVNDISGGMMDPDMFGTVADLKVPYILMHTRGTPADMQTKCQYEDVTAEVLSSLAFRDAELRRMGVCDVIIDPGFGFAKDFSQNYAMMSRLEMFRELHRPLLVGVSRKSMVSKALGCTAADALNGTTALNTVALMKGADILRVHDVREAVEAVKIVSLIKENQ